MSLMHNDNQHAMKLRKHPHLRRKTEKDKARNTTKSNLQRTEVKLRLAPTSSPPTPATGSTADVLMIGPVEAILASTLTLSRYYWAVFVPARHLEGQTFSLVYHPLLTSLAELVLNVCDTKRDNVHLHTLEGTQISPPLDYFDKGRNMITCCEYAH